MNDSTPEDDEPTSFSQKTKDWYEKHKPKIRVAFGVTLAVGLGLVAVALHQRQNGEGCGMEDIGDSLEPEPTEPRQSSLDPDRDPFLRRLPLGHRASGAARERYRELTGDELPPGYTVVRRWMYLGEASEEEEPGEAAA
ncbi:hypothetical protein ACWEOV_40920 [Streptomyces sp. NPDC004365]